MINQPQTGITWLKVFWLLFKGSPDVIGKGYKWKSGFMAVALVGTFAMPFIGEHFRAQYLGTLPPEAPLIRATGQFVRKVAEIGIRREPYADFETDDGRHYVTSRQVMISSGLEALARTEPPVHVYAEGFLLQNGEGSYWPLVIRDLAGTDLIPPQDLQGSLQRARNPWKVKVYAVMYLFVGVFWVISILNACRLKKKLNPIRQGGKL